MLIKNAKIYTMNSSDEIISYGYIAVKNGKISDVGKMPFDSAEKIDEVVDAEGLVVMPGLIDAHSHLGIIGDSLGFESDDLNEITDPVLPQLNAIDAVNPMDRYFKEAYSAGVTTVAAGPGSANAIGGTAIAMKTFGRRIDDMVIKSPVAIKMALGENPKCCYHPKGDAPETRMSTASLIREQLTKASRYLEAMDEYNNAPDKDEAEKPEYDAKCEALVPLLRGQIPAHIHAHRADDIFTAIRLAKTFGFKYKIVHCTEGHLISDILGEEKCEAFIGPVIGDRSKPELKNFSPKTAAILSKSGVKVAIVTDHPELVSQYLLLSAEICHHCGMDYMESLRAVTINPAQMLGIDSIVGSVEKGKDADLVFFRGDISYHTVDKVMINGNFCDICPPYEK
ncbi:MAG: amidohydrolase [Clostridia bacterium]|nr:amidohydrolase [Clostridia bacterium]